MRVRRLSLRSAGDHLHDLHAPSPTAAPAAQRSGVPWPDSLGSSISQHEGPRHLRQRRSRQHGLETGVHRSLAGAQGRLAVRGRGTGPGLREPLGPPGEAALLVAEVEVRLSCTAREYAEQVA